MHPGTVLVSSVWKIRRTQTSNVLLDMHPHPGKKPLFHFFFNLSGQEVCLCCHLRSSLKSATAWPELLVLVTVI